MARRARALLLVVLACSRASAQVLDGGVPPVAVVAPSSTLVPIPFTNEIYGGCPATAERAVAVEGPDGGTGWFMPEARAARTACLLASCEENRQFRDGEKAIPGIAPGVVAIVSGVILIVGGLAFAGGWVYGRATR